MEQPRTLPTVELQLTDLRRNLWVVQRNAEGLDDAQALVNSWEGGSHFAWLVGHMTHSRCDILRAMGLDAPWSIDRGEPYRAGSTPARPGEAEPFAELLEALAATQAPLETALATLTEAERERELTPGRSSVGQRIDFMVWHDSYHSGQSALYRRIAGLERTGP
jgi:uncharacterized damage-inducible protein DinB